MNTPLYYMDSAGMFMFGPDGVSKIDFSRIDDPTKWSAENAICTPALEYDPEAAQVQKISEEVKRAVDDFFKIKSGT